MLLLFKTAEATIRDDGDLRRFTRDAGRLFSETSSQLAEKTYRPEFLDEPVLESRFDRFSVWVLGFARGLLFRTEKSRDIVEKLLDPFFSMVSYGRSLGIGKARGALAGTPIRTKDATAAGRSECFRRLDEFYQLLPSGLCDVAGR